MTLYHYNEETVRVEESGPMFAVHFLDENLQSREVVFVRQEEFLQDAEPCGKVEEPLCLKGGAA